MTTQSSRSATNHPRQLVIFGCMCLVLVLAACSGAPASPAPSAVPNLSASPTLAQPSPSARPIPSDTVVSMPTTISTEPATIAPPPNQVQPTQTATTETPATSAGTVGSSITTENWSVTLHDAQLLDSFREANGQEVQRPGFKNVLLIVGFKRLAIKSDFNDTRGGYVELHDTDGDRYSCIDELRDGPFTIPVGYEFRASQSCQVPATVAGSLKPFQVSVVLNASGHSIGEVKADFALGDRAATAPDVPINFEPERVVSIGQVVTVDFGNTQDALKFTVENPRWTQKWGVRPGLTLGVGEEALLIDVKITNQGKRIPPFAFALIRPLDMVSRASTSIASFPAGMDIPPPGQTKTITIPAGGMKPVNGDVPIFIVAGAKLNGGNYLVVPTTPTRE